jgi:hypothetical protein
MYSHIDVCCVILAVLVILVYISGDYLVQCNETIMPLYMYQYVCIESDDVSRT